MKGCYQHMELPGQMIAHCLLTVHLLLYSCSQLSAVLTGNAELSANEIQTS